MVSNPPGLVTSGDLIPINKASTLPALEVSTPSTSKPSQSMKADDICPMGTTGR